VLTFSSYTPVGGMKCPNDTASPLNPAITNDILRRLNWMLNTYYNPQLSPPVLNTCTLGVPLTGGYAGSPSGTVTAAGSYGPPTGSDIQSAIWTITGDAHNQSGRHPQPGGRPRPGRVCRSMPHVDPRTHACHSLSEPHLRRGMHSPVVPHVVCAWLLMPQHAHGPGVLPSNAHCTLHACWVRSQHPRHPSARPCRMRTPARQNENCCCWCARAGNNRYGSGLGAYSDDVVNCLVYNALNTPIPADYTPPCGGTVAVVLVPCDTNNQFAQAQVTIAQVTVASVPVPCPCQVRPCLLRPTSWTLLIRATTGRLWRQQRSAGAHH
jgi:hypothetical protein